MIAPMTVVLTLTVIIMVVQQMCVHFQHQDQRFVVQQVAQVVNLQVHQQRYQHYQLQPHLLAFIHQPIHQQSHQQIHQ